MDQIVSIPLPDPSIGWDRSTIEGGDRHWRLLPFFVGPENQLVELAACAVLESSTPKYNPMVIAGPSGLGKSHLVHGLAAAYHAKYPNHPVVCQPALDFAQQWTEALQCQATDRFRRRYHSARLLMLEDLTRLAEREQAQQALVPLLDAAGAAAHQVVITAPSPPGRWDRISPALQTRLEAGLCIHLVPPGTKARAAILRHAAVERGLPLTDPVVRILANGLASNVRDLLGTLVGLHAAAQLDGQPIDVDMARAYVAQQRAGSSAELPEIASAVARVFSVPVGQLRGRSQRHEVAVARGVAMHLARRFTELTLEEIGRYFGGRDHTTVLYQCRKTANSRNVDPSIERMMEQVEEILHTQRPRPREQVVAGTL